MRKLLSVCLVCCLAGFAYGELIWDNGDANMVDGIRCQRVGSCQLADVADDVHTTHDWTVTGAYWETVDGPSYDWDGTGDMIIYEYTANGPGAPVVELWNVPNTREYVGTQFGRPWWGYTIEGLDVPLPAGDYYLLLRPFTPGNVDASFWLTSDAPDGSQSEFYFRSAFYGYPDWVPATSVLGAPYDVNFKLYGIPEPASLTLLALGGLALRRRR